MKALKDNSREELEVLLAQLPDSNEKVNVWNELAAKTLHNDPERCRQQARAAIVSELLEKTWKTNEQGHSMGEE